MRVMSPIRIWIALMICIILCVGFFNSKIFYYFKSREKQFHTHFCIRNKTTSFIPIPQIMKKVIKGMLITKASSYETLLQITETIKDQYTNKGIDEITLTIHNENNGSYEEELPYEPISKGTIIITYDSQSFGSTNITLNE